MFLRLVSPDWFLWEPMAVQSLLLPTTLAALLMAPLPKALRKLPVAATSEENGTDIPALFPVPLVF